MTQFDFWQPTTAQQAAILSQLLHHHWLNQTNLTAWLKTPGGQRFNQQLHQAINQIDDYQRLAQLTPKLLPTALKMYQQANPNTKLESLDNLRVFVASMWLRDYLPIHRVFQQLLQTLNHADNAQIAFINFIGGLQIYTQQLQQKLNLRKETEREQ